MRSLHKQKSLDIPDLKHPKKFVKLTGSYLYSKLALVLMMNHLSAENPEVRIISADPGGNKTNMTSSEAVPFFMPSQFWARRQWEARTVSLGGLPENIQL